MATRYCGRATVNVKYDPNARGHRSNYWCTISIGGKHAYSTWVGSPASGFGHGIGHDSPKAYDETAHAALSFAMGDKAETSDGTSVEEAIDYNSSLSGYAISRSKPKRSNPRRRAVRRNCR